MVALYRLRWQVELLFKRWKGLLGLEQVRARRSVLVEVYLLGKILGGLLLEGWSRALGVSGLGAWFAEEARAVSLWRWQAWWCEVLREVVRGELGVSAVVEALPLLGRYLREGSRWRCSQGAWARVWLRALRDEQLGVEAR